MKKFKYLMTLVISTIFIGCSNFQPPKKVVSVEYSKDNKAIVTTYEDGSTMVENVEFLKWKNKNNQEQRKDDRRDGIR
ncbi:MULTISPECIES: hypothetical protein [Psychrilyobacter]|uniref:Lipoprotein n=1 Tax=Psychrilyobacter piezotolerans TaxID=2293438 RepID=A0ABX9KKM1_9FUSO|nr:MULTISPECIES: hypothetical protein [Psychrilyobacter]MCS5421038.1 hypothetical protein [Psychrilyobacter sp. S5]NDI76317.1 hypothetical protein [Psychrilyobacter piezotolerans]RDE65916.1 hypothetical protein DV867_00130 [Psychrilyobacter sp. S5]REI43094.1 hypothetical protein DYH56_00130 [Psychrilyobacter piezotolerans]